MRNAADLWTEAQEALERVWFVQSVEETERTGFTLTIMSHCRKDFEPNPLLKFLSLVEDLLLQQQLL